MKYDPTLETTEVSELVSAAYESLCRFQRFTGMPSQCAFLYVSREWINHLGFTGSDLEIIGLPVRVDESIKGKVVYVT